MTEDRRQRNIDSIAGKTLSYLPADLNGVSESPVEEDLVFIFWNSCKDVGDETMQRLWAQILAGEIKEPGSFSLRTISLIRLLRRSEAELFMRLCGYLWEINGDAYPIICRNHNIPLGEDNLTPFDSDDLAILTSAGLVQLEPFGKELNTGPGTSNLFKYQTTTYIVKDHVAVHQPSPTGPYILTPEAKELLRLVSPEHHAEYEQEVLELFKNKYVDLYFIKT